MDAKSLPSIPEPACCARIKRVGGLPPGGGGWQPWDHPTHVELYRSGLPRLPRGWLDPERIKNAFGSYWKTMNGPADARAATPCGEVCHFTAGEFLQWLCRYRSAITCFQEKFSIKEIDAVETFYNAAWAEEKYHADAEPAEVDWTYLTSRAGELGDLESDGEVMKQFAWENEKIKDRKSRIPALKKGVEGLKRPELIEKLKLRRLKLQTLLLEQDAGEKPNDLPPQKRWALERECELLDILEGKGMAGGLTTREAMAILEGRTGKSFLWLTREFKALNGFKKHLPFYWEKYQEHMFSCAKGPHQRAKWLFLSGWCVAHGEQWREPETLSFAPAVETEDGLEVGPSPSTSDSSGFPLPVTRNLKTPCPLFVDEEAWRVPLCLWKSRALVKLTEVLGDERLVDGPAQYGRVAEDRIKEMGLPSLKTKWVALSPDGSRVIKLTAPSGTRGVRHPSV
jgi:hypothetical protein